MASYGSPVKFTPTSPKRRKNDIVWEKCIVCQCTTSEQLISMRAVGKKSFIEAMDIRRDLVCDRVMQQLTSLNNLLSLDERVVYHRACYRTYTSRQNCSVFKLETGSQVCDQSDPQVSPQPDTFIQTRAQFPPCSLDVKTCFLCKNKTFKKDRKLHKIESRERVDGLLKCADASNDLSMAKIISSKDFFPNAVYHSACITKYLLKSTPVKPDNTVYEESEHELAFKSLITIINDDLFLHKKAFLMSHILDIYQSLLPQNVCDTYQSYKLQNKLISYYGSSITIQTQRGQGMSNIVFSSELTIGDAISAAGKLKSMLRLSELHQGVSADIKETLNEGQLLHSAANTLRRDIKNLAISSDDYPSANEASLGASMENMPASLLKFICWLIDEKSHKVASEPYVVPQDKLRKSMAITECIVSVAKSAFTPFHLGLAVQLHHEYGSRTLIETLYSHGFCASYAEVRRYLTSIAMHEVGRIQDGIYVPDGIVSNHQGGYLIQEGAENIDLNTETIDGKDTFHSMARAVFQVCPSTIVSTLRQIKVKRGQDKTFPLTDNASSLTAVLPFIKPKVRGVPVRVPNAFNNILKCAEKMQNTSEILWVILRSMSRDIDNFPVQLDKFDHQTIPFWTGYNSTLSEFRHEFAVVSYAPIVDAKPSDMSTVYTTMKRCSDMTKSMGQTYSIQTFDQQLYAIAKQVEWAMPETFKTHIIRLGGFHTLSCFIASIGKLWGDGGLKDLLIDSSVYAAGTVDQMMCGKQFNRAVRALTVAYEALVALWLSAFFQWCRDNDLMASFPDRFWSLLSEVVSNFKSDKDNNKSVNEALIVVRTILMPRLEEFRQWGCQSSPTFKYWDMFLRAVEIMIQNVRAEREGSWDMHLTSISSMLPYMFIANRVNYSRWLPVYILDMLNLTSDIQPAFSAGQFAIRQKPGKFNGIWSDMATEKTVIKDSKGRGGIVGITRQKSALIRWSLTRHVLAEFSAEMRTRSGFSAPEEPSHEETRPTALRRDEEHVKLVIEHVQQRMTNPFDIKSHPKALINISTGMHAPTEIESSLTKAFDDGIKMVKSFVNGALAEGSNSDFYGPISRSKIKTFEDLTKKSKIKCRSGEVLSVHISPELVFRRALVLAGCREDITIEKVLSLPIGPVPTSLFHEDGTMRKTCKADLCHQIEAEAATKHQLAPYDRSASVLIRDGMALVQSLHVKTFRTFGDLALHLIQSQKSCLSNAATVVDVFDRYDLKHSIKSSERDRRTGVNSSQKVFQVIDGRSIPDWKKFLAVNANKQALLKFLGDFTLRHHAQYPVLTSPEDKLYLAGIFVDPIVVKMLSSTGVSDCHDLFSTHEEADTRMILHAMFADEEFGKENKKGRIIIKSPDTDVLILCMHFFPSMKNTHELWFQTGTISSNKGCRRYLPVHELCSALNPVMCKVLPAVHALTGCDTTSSLFGIGKKTVYKVLKDNLADFVDLDLLSSGDIDKSVGVSRTFVARLYDQKRKVKFDHIDLNKLRVKKAKQKDASLAKLPPCESTFLQHVLRASLQTTIWTSSNIAQPPHQSPLDFGWEDKNGLTPTLFKGQMSSDYLQDLICTCKGKSVCSKSCVCFEQNLSCTELCPCQGSEACCNSNTRTESANDDEEIDP